MKKIITTAICFGLQLYIFAQVNYPKKAIGVFSGVMDIPGGKVELLMKIHEKDSTLSCKMDIPAQNVKDIPASSTIFKNDSITIEFKTFTAVYKAKFNKDSVNYTGTWSQNGANVPLKLSLARKEKELERPQNPVKPYPYNEEEVVFENKKDNVKLSGTFTFPKDKKNCPVAILISGSGPQNRDEELMGHKPFLVIADYLTRNGIAVLRYDDRGTGSSTGDFKAATSLDFSYDAEAAVEYIKTRKEINLKKIGLIGHSEGGMIAPMLASRNKDLSYIVMIAGPGIKCSELMLLQTAAQAKSMGVDENSLNIISAVNKKVYELAASNEKNIEDSLRNILVRSGMTNKAALDKQIKTITSPWFRYFLAYDPTPALLKLTCPVLALNGKKDLQVTYPQNLEGIEATLKKSGNKNYTVKAFDDLNHLMQHCKTGSVSEYGTIEETFSSEVSKFISDWILKI